MRRVNYRTAINGFVFTALWLAIGAVVMWSPVPEALGIAGGFFTAWLLLFFLVLAVAGMILTLAAINAAFPPSLGRPQPPSRTPARRAGAPSWAPPHTAGAPASSRASQRDR